MARFQFKEIPDLFSPRSTQPINAEANMNEHFCSVIYKEIVIEYVVVKNVTTVSSAVLFSGIISF